MADVKEFNLSTLDQYDGGRVHKAFDLAVQRCLVDCEDRPGDKRARKVSLEFIVKPLGDDGFLDSIEGAFRIKDNLPDRRSAPMAFHVRKRSGKLQLTFLTDDQQTLFDESESQTTEE